MDGLLGYTAGTSIYKDLTDNEKGVLVVLTQK